MSGTVGATARIEDHAVVLTGSTATSGTVGGLTILMNGMTVSGGREPLTKTSGTHCGFVENTINSNCAGADVTLAPPYVWRP